MRKLFRKLCGKVTPSELLVYPKKKMARMTIQLINGNEETFDISSNDIVNGKPEKEFENFVAKFNQPYGSDLLEFTDDCAKHIIVSSAIISINIRTWIKISY